MDDVLVRPGRLAAAVAALAPYGGCTFDRRPRGVRARASRGNRIVIRYAADEAAAAERLLAACRALEVARG